MMRARAGPQLDAVARHHHDLIGNLDVGDLIR